MQSRAGTHYDDEAHDVHGELDEEFDMGQWEVIGTQGSYADCVCKGKHKEEDKDVAIKVISLANESLQRYCQDEVARIAAVSCSQLSASDLESIYRRKVLQEYTMTNQLNNDHIYEFYGVYTSSSSYCSVVLCDEQHPAWRGDLRPLGPPPHCFIVMEPLAGNDLQNYHFRDRGACGFLCKFEAAPGVTAEFVLEHLQRFRTGDFHYDSMLEKNEISISDFMFAGAEGCSIKTVDAVPCVILRFKKDKFVCDRSPLYEDVKWQAKLRRFAERVRRHLLGEQLIQNEEAISERTPKHTPPLLHYSETFVRSVLKQCMLALAHAHGYSVFHSDLKPDNIMFKAPVSAHSESEIGVCVKIIDWGCSGFSKEKKHEAKHVFLPPLHAHSNEEQDAREAIGPKFDVFSVGQILRWMFL